jgi:hypothetical protein
MLRRAAGLLVALAAGAMAAPRAVTPAAAADAVTGLPGWETDAGAALPLPSKHFSGYLPVGDGSDDRHIHYYHIEAEIEPEKAPLILWLNGGPGSSSLFGMFTEVGQLVFNRDSLRTNSTEAPRLFRNPESWTTFANMVFLESPVGVGWSYCAASLSSGKPCVCNDTSTANENHDALLAFTARHPSLKDRPFFVSGESYAGIYIPTLAEVIMNKGGMNLQGMAVGNGCWGSGENLYCGFGKEQKRLEAEFLLSATASTARQSRRSSTPPATGPLARSPPCRTLAQKVRPDTAAVSCKARRVRRGGGHFCELLNPHPSGLVAPVPQC